MKPEREQPSEEKRARLARYEQAASDLSSVPISARTAEAYEELATLALEAGELFAAETCRKRAKRLREIT